MAWLNLKKKDEDTLVIDENEEFYNPPTAESPRRRPDDTDLLLPVEEDEAEVAEEDEGRKRKVRKQRSKRYGHVKDDEPEEEEEEPDETEWLSPVKPSVSLPSRSIVELSLRNTAAQRMRKVMVIVGAGLVAATITCAGLNIYSAGQLSGEKAKGQSLQQQVDKMKPLADYYDGYTQRRSAVSDTLKTDVQYSLVQSALLGTAKQDGVTVKSEAVAPGQPCASMDPFTKTDGLGCITAQIQSSGGTSALATFADGLNSKPGLVGAYLSGISSQAGISSATVNVSFNSQTLSERYKEFAGGTAATTGGTPSTNGSTATPGGK